MINAGAEVNLQDDEGYSPLHIAVDSYNGPIYEDILIYLAERGADSELKTNTGETALHRACIGGHFEAVRMLILMEVDLDARDNYGWYPLHSAASKGRNDIIGLLLEAHCDINCTDMKGYTPLHRAILKNQVPTVEFLLLNDANVKMITDDGNTPLCMVCASSGSVDLANILILEGTIISAKYGPDKISPLHLAATKGHTDLVRVLVSVGISPNVRDISGMTPLHRAAFKGQTEMAQLLISLGSDPLLKDGSGATPYDLAVDSSHQDTAAYLKEFQR